MKTIKATGYNVYVGKQVLAQLSKDLKKRKYTQVFVLVDENTSKHCLPLARKMCPALAKAVVIKIKSSEQNKNLKSCESIWKVLTNHSADRSSVLINLGGGVICDLGGFAASAYKRGIDFIQVPTTLLSQVDASVGGKTGIDLYDFKNQIGTFSFPQAVYVNPGFLETLDKRQKLSGFAEVIKHALIADSKYWGYLFGNDFLAFDDEYMIAHSIEIKNRIVKSDPKEKGKRKLLNFGHTVGHAIETALLRTKKPLLHGEAIAIGMIVEARLSYKRNKLSGRDLNAIEFILFSLFPTQKIGINAGKLMQLMQQDKKNRGTQIRFALLSKIGKAKIDVVCTPAQIKEAIRYYNKKH